MNKIYYMMGKSSSGKDTLQKELKEALPGLRTITPYTTRPRRDGERDGMEYFFVSEDTLNIFERQGRVIEQRAYNTVHGIWRYATVDCGTGCGLSCDWDAGILLQDEGILWREERCSALYRSGGRRTAETCDQAGGGTEDSGL